MWPDLGKRRGAGWTRTSDQRIMRSLPRRQSTCTSARFCCSDPISGCH